MHARVRDILERHGSETVSFQALEPGLAYWFADDDAFVAYADTGGAWVAAGSPVCAPERRDEVLRGFVRAARAAGRRACFFAAEAAPPGDVSALHIGEQPFWEPASWPQALRRKRSLREQLRRARAKGVVSRELDPGELSPGRGERARLDALLRRWQERRSMAPMGFLVTLDVHGHADQRRYLIAEHAGRLVGLLVAVPVYAANGWFFEDVLRDPAAPNGTIELLFDAGMRRAAEAGIDTVTFGLAPLAGTTARPLAAIRDRTRWLYDFVGLRAFKAKLQPARWRPVYLIHPADEGAPRAVADALRAFAGGSLLAFAGRSLAHRAPELTWLLAALLLPWTALLAAAPTDPWFPSAGAQAAWVAYDALLFVGLTALARRWRPRLARLLALGAAVDVCLGSAQALTHTLERISGIGSHLVVAAALLAPLAACALLIGSAGRARLYLGGRRNGESRDLTAAALDVDARNAG